MDADEVIDEIEREPCNGFRTFFEKAFVRRVKRRMLIRMVRFWRSTYDVLMCLFFGLPIFGVFLIPVHSAGL